ncbi:hypothetical protein BB561_001798 [Smittium simulii]|uniref:Large ribosomal subunit protein mL40 n=1 Tax=Smittium simulii TaxID=133385 RepID=A0A2T9YT61_9FUNG|nr:hypothetical protein BB561_001798 [Smittium simulii]
MKSLIIRSIHSTRVIASQAPDSIRQPRSKSKGNSDPRNDQIKQILFDTEQKQIKNFTKEDLNRHETIQTAYQLFIKEFESKRSAERVAKFAAMEAAYKELENTDMNLLRDACKKPLEPLFPMKLRVPTDTPPKIIWDYNSYYKK